MSISRILVLSSLRFLSDYIFLLVSLLAVIVIFTENFLEFYKIRSGPSISCKHASYDLIQLTWIDFSEFLQMFLQLWFVDT